MRESTGTQQTENFEVREMEFLCATTGIGSWEMGRVPLLWERDTFPTPAGGAARKARQAGAEAVPGLVLALPIRWRSDTSWPLRFSH